MKKSIWLYAGVAVLGVILLMRFLPVGTPSALTQREGQPHPALTEKSPPQPIVRDATRAMPSVSPQIAPRKEDSIQSLPVKLTDAQGEVRKIDVKSAASPGFIETKKGAHYRVQLTWPHGDKVVWATRMDGGTFDGDKGMVLKLPASGRGEIDFGYVTGPEPGRYQIELAGASGAIEHIAFWADPPNLPVEPSGTTFIDPPLRKTARQ